MCQYGIYQILSYFSLGPWMIPEFFELSAYSQCLEITKKSLIWIFALKIVFEMSEFYSNLENNKDNCEFLAWKFKY